MSLGNFFSKFFSAKPELKLSPPVKYKDFTIQANPQAESGQFRTCGIIRKVVATETKEVVFHRADLHHSQQGAAEHAIQKAQRIIDEQGDKVFEKSHV